MAAMLAIALPRATVAQYPGQVSTKPTDQQILRSIAVLEWTGEPGKPKTSRLIPVAIFDGQTLQDGGIYLARPMPLAVSGGVEYELRQNGKNVGLYDIRSAGQQQGLWVGFGAWKPMPKPKPVETATTLSNQVQEGDDQPTLHRKHHGSDSSKSSKTSSAPAPDPDRPTLHKNTTDESASSTDEDRPTLHKKDDGSTSGSNTASSPAPDPDRPRLHAEEKQAKPATQVGYVSSLPNVPDPDRPRLLRGKPQTEESDLIPDLIGVPEQMHQTVAVSDVRNRPEHIWSFSWSNPADELRLKGELEDIARDALGVASSAATIEKPKTSHARKLHPPRTASAPPPPPPQMVGEDFRVFELTYGSGATMVLSARTDGSLSDQRFVTLIAQPDLYGNVRVLLKHVTDGRHLDDTPRMRLVDAVDALSDNRAELLFELRGRSQRQFALYRIYRGQVEKLFVTAGEWLGMPSGE